MDETVSGAQTPLFELLSRRARIADPRGIVGSAAAQHMASENCTASTIGRHEPDRRRHAGIERGLADRWPDVVVMTHATAGSTQVNSTWPIEFLCGRLASEATSIYTDRIQAINENSGDTTGRFGHLTFSADKSHGSAEKLWDASHLIAFSWRTWVALHGSAPTVYRLNNCNFVGRDISRVAESVGSVC